MKMVHILITLLMLIPIGEASSENITPDDIIAGNITASDLIADQRTSNFNESTYTYTIIKDISNAKGIETIKVRFKNAFRGVDQNLATIDRVWQVSDTDSSQVITNDPFKKTCSYNTSLKLKEGYELAIKAIDIDGNKVYVELSKNGAVVDTAVIITSQKVDDIYTFAKDIGQAKDVDVIKVHFKNAFRGANQSLATIDRVWQVSDTDPSQVIINNSFRGTFTRGTTLKLEEGYELAIKSIDIDGNKVYVELSRNPVVDSAVVIPPQKVDGIYTFVKDIGQAKDVEVIKVHFENAFRGTNQSLATVDQIWQVSDTNSSQVIINNSFQRTITSNTPLKLEEGYELAIKSIEIDGNRLYVELELSKNGVVVDSAAIIPRPSHKSVVDTAVIITSQKVDDIYTFAKDIGQAKDVEVIKVHFKNAFRGADQSLATIDRVWQVSDTDPSQVIINNSFRGTFTRGTTLKLEEGYELAIKSIDIDGNKVYVELSKNGAVVDSAVIITSP